MTESSTLTSAIPANRSWARPNAAPHHQPLWAIAEKIPELDQGEELSGDEVHDVAQGLRAGAIRGDGRP